jgi:hypothetical protein
MVMNDDVERRRVDRFRYLKSACEATEWDTHNYLNMWDLGRSLGFSEQQTEQIVQYLVNERLMVFVALGGTVGVTHEGIKEVERAIASPSNSTEHFPPVTVINNIMSVTGGMSNSQVMQSSDRSSQSMAAAPIDKEPIQKILDELKASMDALPVGVREDVSGHVQSAEGQLRVSNPSGAVLKSILSSIVLSVAGNAAYAGIAMAIEKVLQVL